jgi:hypothetical protein
LLAQFKLETAQPRSDFDDGLGSGLPEKFEQCDDDASFLPLPTLTV